MGEAIKCLIGGWTHKQYYLREREWQIIAAMAECSHGQLRSLTSLSSCNPKLVWRRGKGLTITSAVGGGLRSLRSVRKETEKPSAPPKTTSSSFSPLSCVFFRTVCPWLFRYEQSSTVHYSAFDSTSVLLYVQTVFVFTVFMRSCHFR